MSYILDALKKSDNERKKGSIPDLQSQHTIYPGFDTARKKKSKSVWIVLLTVIVVVSSGTALFLLAPYLPFSFQVIQKDSATAADEKQPTELKKVQLVVQASTPQQVKAPDTLEQGAQRLRQHEAPTRTTVRQSNPPQGAVESQDAIKQGEPPALSEQHIAKRTAVPEVIQKPITKPGAAPEVIERKVTQRTESSGVTEQPTAVPAIAVQSEPLPTELPEVSPQQDIAQHTEPSDVTQQSVTQQTTGNSLSVPPEADEQAAPSSTSSLHPAPIILAEEATSGEQGGKFITKENLPFLTELSADVKADLPKLSFAGHTYSKEPARRMIIINNRIKREGQWIEKGLFLEEITWDGVVLNLNGLRFQVVTTQ